ncbi:hypothetical protein LDO32_14375 [Luteimonas sp. Y-2-2-4F]|nr:hypothetical protein [Luteimonas sp. Y-2-2-4F]MCD9032913.1 hypothetical protein [Luteimonas sp. Y-2-2-4F]
MNAATTTPALRRRLPAWLDALLTATVAWRAVLALLCALPLGALGLAMRLQGGPDLARVAEIVLAFALAVLWGGWLVRGILLARHARQACLPGMGRAVARALLAAGGASLLLPALALAAGGVAPATAAAVVVAGAAGGSLFVLASWQTLGWAYLAWLAASGALWLAGLQWPWSDAGPDTRWRLLALGLAAAAAWCWRGVLRADTLQGMARFARAIVLAQSDPMSRETGGDVADWSNGTIGSARLATLAPGSEPGLRALLGPPFQPMSRLGRLLQALAAAAMLATLAWLPPAMLGGALTGMALMHMILAFVVIQRMEVLRVARSGEFAELALLPGLGGDAGATMLLRRATLGWLARASLIVLAVQLGLAIAAGLPAVSVVAALFGWAGIAIAVLLAGARSLAGGSVYRFGPMALLAASLLLAFACAVAAIVSPPPLAVLAWLGAAWLPLFGYSLWRLRALLDAAARRPHPFLAG